MTTPPIAPRSAGVFADKPQATSDDAGVPPPPRTRVGLYLPTSTVRRIRGLVAALHGTDKQVSLNEFFDEAVREKAERVERVENGGAQFPPVDEVGRGAGGRRIAGEPDPAAPSGEHPGDEGS